MAWHVCKENLVGKAGMHVQSLIMGFHFLSTKFDRVKIIFWGATAHTNACVSNLWEFGFV